MIIFLYGADTFRSRKKLNELKDKFIREVNPDGSGIVLVDGEKATLEKINEAVAPASLFSRRRFIIVEDVFKNKSDRLWDKLGEFLGKLKDEKESNIVVLRDEISREEKLAGARKKFFDFLAASKYAQEFKKLAGREITGWIGGEAATDGFSITPEAAGMLAEFFGADLWQLKNEWDKIIGHKKAADPKGKEISAEDVLAISFGRIENSIFALTDAIGARDRALAFRLLEEELSAGGEPGYIFNMILRQVRIVLEIRESLDLGKSAREIAAAFKLKPFVVQKGMNQARRFTAEQLKKLFSRLVEADYLVKTGRGEIKTLVELALAD